MSKLVMLKNVETTAKELKEKRLKTIQPCLDACRNEFENAIQDGKLPNDIKLGWVIVLPTPEGYLTITLPVLEDCTIQETYLLQKEAFKRIKSGMSKDEMTNIFNSICQTIYSGSFRDLDLSEYSLLIWQFICFMNDLDNQHSDDLGAGFSSIEFYDDLEVVFIDFQVKITETDENAESDNQPNPEN